MKDSETQTWELSLTSGLKGLSRKELVLAVAVIMVDVASSDETFEPTEYNVISRGLRRLFGTDEEEVRGLINQATQILSSLRGTSKYTQQLRENVSVADRRTIFLTIQELIEADGREDPFEVYMRSRLAKALDIPLE